MVVSASASISGKLTVGKSFGDFGTPNIPVGLDSVLSLYGSGSGAGQFNAGYAGSRTVATGAPDVLDLTGGALQQPDGSSVVFADILAFIFKNTGSVTLNLGGGSNPVSSMWGSSAIPVAPGETVVFLLPGASGFAINGSTAHNIQVAAQSGTGSYDIFIVGH